MQVGVHSLALGLLGSVLLPLAAFADAGTTTPAAATELETLRAEVAALRANVAERDATIQRLETRASNLEQNLTSVQSAIALATNGAPSRHYAAGSPSSNLDWGSAMKAATAARFMVPGASMLTVMPTGSMKPVFDERAILLMEPARFDDLQVGDIVTYKHPQYGLPVVHRILEKRGDKFWAKGDNNGRMDEVYITRANYQARVFGIIYAREASGQAQRFTTLTASK